MLSPLPTDARVKLLPHYSFLPCIKKLLFNILTREIIVPLFLLLFLFFPQNPYFFFLSQTTYWAELSCCVLNCKASEPHSLPAAVSTSTVFTL